MADLADQLKQSLPQYRIERELGGGGMSRVFLAEEVALARRVVLKILPPELSVLLSADRFQREVRLAASLQHPHIVTLLSAGRVGDILYYTMPFVEGESLRSRLNREGELPVEDVHRLVREVVDALGYAHAQGIIHRDIKPDNILESSHHAVITDFGIAKALREADEHSRLTGSGISIGTPAYMSPEQAAGEREIDQRTDIYAVGVLAYELLTGEPPFRGPNAQAVIAAHMTRAPAPVSELRASVPRELEAIVLRCLEKRPADRFQETDDLLVELDAIGGPATRTGGVSRPVIAAARSAAGPAGAAWPLPRVLGYFGVATAAVLALTWGLRTLLGLPDWFFAAAVVLLALGLPIVIAAALAHNRRVEAGPGQRTPPGIPRRLTLRRAVAGGVAAFGALGMVTAGYMGMRALGIGPVGTLVASGKLNQRDRLIIADFSNQTRDPLLGPAITQAFRVDFAQSKLVSPVEADYVRRVLRRMQRPDSAPVDLATAQEIAQRQGFKAVIAGSLQQVGPSVLVSAQLVSADSGIVLYTARATARDSTGILDAVDQVSRELRNKIGESLRAIRANLPLAEVTTASLDALRKYSQAIHAESQGDNPGAIALLGESVARDTGFAMAWRKLGTMLANSGESPARADSALTRAYALRHRLTFREQKLTEDSYFMDAIGANDSAVAALQSLLAEYPDDSWAHNNLGVAYEVTGSRELAEQSYRRSVQLEPENSIAWRNVLSVRISLGAFDSAAATLGEIRRRFPPGPALENSELLLELGRRDFVAGEARLRRVIPLYRANPAAYDQFLNLFAGVLAVRGKLTEANRTFQTLIDLRSSTGRRARALDATFRRVVAEGLKSDDHRTAKAELDRVMKPDPLEPLSGRERPLVMATRAAVAAGDRERAIRFLDLLDLEQGNLPRRLGASIRELVRGSVLSMRDQTLPQAIAATQKASAFCSFCAAVPIARAFDRLNRPDSALAYYKIWAEEGETSWEGGQYFLYQPDAYFRMGELYQAGADTSRAATYYGKFVALWKDADPELQPRVREARLRLAELTGERGRQIQIPTRP